MANQENAHKSPDLFLVSFIQYIIIIVRYMHRVLLLYCCHAFTINAFLKAPTDFINQQQEETRAHGTINFKTYYKFFRAGANVLVLAIMVIVFILGEVSILCIRSLIMSTHKLRCVYIVDQ